jgi:hypothetical protein
MATMNMPPEAIRNIAQIQREVDGIMPPNTESFWPKEAGPPAKARAPAAAPPPQANRRWGPKEFATPKARGARQDAPIR